MADVIDAISSGRIHVEAEAVDAEWQGARADDGEVVVMVVD